MFVGEVFKRLVIQRLPIALLLRSNNAQDSIVNYSYTSASSLVGPRSTHTDLRLRRTSATHSVRIDRVETHHKTMFDSFDEAAKHVSHETLGKYGLVESSPSTSSLLVHCGSRACQRDSFQRRLDSSKLLSVASFQEDESNNQKSSKKKKKQPAPQTQTSKDMTSANGIKYSPTKYAVVLSDSIFFPEGGGQPPDQGMLRIVHNRSDDNADELVLHVSNSQNIGNVCVLTCLVASSDADKAARVLHSCYSISESSVDTTSIVQEVDWNRRFDFMTQHSAQHLISAVAHNTFQLDTHSFSLSQSSLTSFIDFCIDDKALTLQEHYEHLKLVETLVNVKIRENLAMTPRWLDPANNVKDAEFFQANVRSRLLPENMIGPIRLVQIGGDADSNANGNIASVDCNTCCGTHVPNLGTLQMIKFFKMEKVKSGIARVYFAAAQRLIQLLEVGHSRSSQITNLLKCPESDHIVRLNAVLEEKRAKEVQLENVYKELCTCRSKEIASTLRQQTKMVDNVAGVAVAIIDLGQAADRNFMTMLSTATIERFMEEAEAARSDGQALLLLVSSSSSNPADSGEEGNFLLSGHPELVDMAGKKLAEILGGRGGGKNGKFQGKGTKLKSGLAEAEKFLKNLAKSE